MVKPQIQQTLINKMIYKKEVIETFILGKDTGLEFIYKYVNGELYHFSFKISDKKIDESTIPFPDYYYFQKMLNSNSLEKE